jgi:hypothetical protein
MNEWGHLRRSLLASLLVGMASATVARGATPTPDYPGPPDGQRISLDDAGLVLATYAMTQPQEQTQYFGGDLTSRGVVPVWLSISNGTSDQTFVVDTDEITVEAAGGDVGNHKDPDNVSGAGGDLVVGQVAVIGSFYALPLVVFADVALVQANVMKRSLIEKAFYSHTLHPGQTGSGFIFLRAPKAHQTLAATSLVVTLHPTPAGPASAKTYHLALVAPPAA